MPSISVKTLRARFFFKFSRKFKKISDVIKFRKGFNTFEFNSVSKYVLKGSYVIGHLFGPVYMNPARRDATRDPACSINSTKCLNDPAFRLLRRDPTSVALMSVQGLFI